MLDDDAQTALDEALTTGAATYKISKGRDALILSVKDGHPLIPLMDQIFGFAGLDLVHNAQRSAGNAVPVLTIEEYAVTPKFRRQEIDGYHVYELIYSRRG
jgi:hypothetical protein